MLARGDRIEAASRALVAAPLSVVSPVSMSCSFPASPRISLFFLSYKNRDFDIKKPPSNCLFKWISKYPNIQPHMEN
jgi:hypothetical protein